MNPTNRAHVEAEPKDDSSARAIAELRHRLDHEEAPPPECGLEPAGAFSNTPATRTDFNNLCPDVKATDTGRNSEAVRWRIASSCAGWGEPPTASEFYDAVRATEPTQRQKAIVLMWGSEATIGEILEAWAQHAYTLHELVRALHLAGFRFPSRIREINRWTTKKTKR